MKKSMLFLGAGLLMAFSAKAVEDSTQLRRISDDILLHGECYDNLRYLCKQIGNRLSGTPAAARAVQWGEAALRTAGADLVFLQPVWVPRWVRGKESLMLSTGAHGAYEILPALSLGNAVGTGGQTLEGEVLYTTDLASFNRLPASAVRGKIVFFDYHFRQDFPNSFRAYGDAIWLRGTAPSAASAKGAAGIIIRSLSTGLDDFAHTGAMRYADTVRKIPSMSIGNSTADKLAAACKGGTIRAKVSSEAQMRDSVLSYNVIGEIRGSEFPNEFIVAGGHLDSWDVGEGAHDDGAGVVQTIELIRTFKALGIRPRHTIRAVLFMNEENGLRGGRAYADSARAKNEKHLVALESDAGGFSPRGIGLEMEDRKKAKVQAWAPLFRTIGIYDFSQEEGGADISPLVKMKIPLAGMMPDAQRYFDYHHTRNDVFENVNHRELKLGAAGMAYFVYLVDEYGL